MKHIILIVSACVIALTLAASTPDSNCGENIFNMNMNINGRYVQLIMKTKPFKSSEHAIMWKQYEIGKGLYPELIDGKIAIGLSNELPKTQIDTMYMLWGDERILISKDLYANCFDPTLLPTKSNRLAPKWEVRVSDDRRSMLVKLSAGEGDFAYSVDWVFSQDGKHSRYLRPGC